MGFFGRFRSSVKDKELELLKSAYSDVFDLFEKDIRQNAPVDYHEMEIVIFCVFVVGYSYCISKGMTDEAYAKAEMFFEFISTRMAEYSCRNEEKPSAALLHGIKEKILNLVKKRITEYVEAWEKDMNNPDKGFVSLLGAFLDNCLAEKISSKQKTVLAEPHLLILPNVIKKCINDFK